ncbi:MAG TPA: PilX N-terminal domain-containing pilus assembly protein [Patescibacteria group bacterium]|nr:PilX N-terminal domain-containing pilus assembly protein [Patescibacteria group bacterium]
MSTTDKQQWKQRGMVSILVTMLLMIVISLIVLGFAQISRRNQRQSLDRQLSTQAFYAAEAGINDARNLIKNAINSGTAVPAKTDCTNGSGAAAAFYGALTPALDSTNNVSYTCLMVDPTPKTLLYNDIHTSSTVIPLISATGTNFASVKLTFLSKDGTANPSSGCPTSASAVFSTTSAWTASGCGYGVLRFDLVPTNGSLTMSGLQDKTMTSFLVPVSSGGTTTIAYPATSPVSSTNANNRVATTCTATGCSMTISGLSTNQYYMRVSAVYKDVSLIVSASDSGGSALSLQGAQAVIDTTGKAQDVLRRVQVHIPLTPSSSNQLSDYAIESTDAICKRFVTMDGYFQSYAASAVSGLTSITTPPNPLCQ